MGNTYERYCIKKTLKMQHGINLTDPQLDTIEEIYFESHKSKITTLMFYRSINFTIGLIGIIFFIFMRNVPEKKWFFLVFVVCFAVYNLAHVIQDYFRYKRLRASKKGI